MGNEAESAQLVCGRKDACPGNSNRFVPKTEKHHVRCCADKDLSSYPLKWVKRPHCKVWGESNVPKCYRDMTFAEAEAQCEHIGARLCTAAELEMDCTRGTGCGHDAKLVWSSDEGCIDRRPRQISSDI